MDSKSFAMFDKHMTNGKKSVNAQPRGVSFKLLTGSESIEKTEVTIFVPRLGRSDAPSVFP
jgi:hypothetical protein